ncbi:hypothetical protein SDC9_94021 [bioreactor metagenome]|uniref:Uncharacterized protein n=1 Tax=bioreactor metagenome TaxID=1076179 RepID=A0A645A2Q7_9ZZZZ
MRVIQPDFADDDKIRHHQRVERNEDARGEKREDRLTPPKAKTGEAIGQHACTEHVEHRGKPADEDGIAHHFDEAGNLQRVDIVGYLPDRGEGERVCKEFGIRLERRDEEPDERKECVQREVDQKDPLQYAAKSGLERVASVQIGCMLLFRHTRIPPLFAAFALDFKERAYAENDDDAHADEHDGGCVCGAVPGVLNLLIEIEHHRAGAVCRAAVGKQIDLLKLPEPHDGGKRHTGQYAALHHGKRDKPCLLNLAGAIDLGGLVKIPVDAGEIRHDDDHVVADVKHPVDQQRGQRRVERAEPIDGKFAFPNQVQKTVDQPVFAVVHRRPEHGQRDAGDDLREKVNGAEELPAPRFSIQNERHQNGQGNLHAGGNQRPDDIVEHAAPEHRVLPDGEIVFYADKRRGRHAVPLKQADD